MANVLDYLQWRGDLPFSVDPLHPVDALIFSALAYISYGGQTAFQPGIPITLKQAADTFFGMDDHEKRVRVKNDLELLRKAADTKRFGQTKLFFFRELLLEEEQTQFAAATFLLDDGTAFLAFRGTDDSLVGWKEDFNMSFQQTVPAQRMALDYTREVAAEFDGLLRLGGHSKGGNLAVFAAARSSCLVRNRILEVYNNDGPGFTEYMMGDPGYLEVVPRIHTYVPQSSVIGMLLEHEEPYTVIKSKQVGLLQHELYSWEVLGPDFLPMEEITADSRFLNLTIKNWVSGMSVQDRNVLVDTMYDLLSSGDVETALDIFHPKNLRSYIRALRRDESARRILMGEFQALIHAARQASEQFSGQNKLDE